MAQSIHSYDSDLFNRSDADVVVPMILDLLTVNSVVDVGCGTGTWLATFADRGVSDFLGIDGDHVPRDKLMITPERFLACDLENPPELGCRFDLCLSLEVAEHLHERSADDFVAFLASLSDTVLFSAAIPGQTGQNHYNLQWPEYWAEKFAKHEYLAYDPFRPLIWGDNRVKWWYQQNILMFSDSSKSIKLKPIMRSLRRVHPDQYLKVLNRLEDAKRSGPRTLKNWIKRWF
jgi:SAM-dependent methyltransferase